MWPWHRDSLFRSRHNSCADFLRNQGTTAMITSVVKMARFTKELCDEVKVAFDEMSSLGMEIKAVSEHLKSVERNTKPYRNLRRHQYQLQVRWDLAFHKYRTPMLDVPPHSKSRHVLKVSPTNALGRGCFYAQRNRPGQ